MSQLYRLYHTLKPLKWRQIWYRATQPVQKRRAKTIKVKDEDLAAAVSMPVVALKKLPAYKRYEAEARAFTFLNKTQQFADKIDWDYKENGLLWTYNLNYFEWLYDEDLSNEVRLQTIYEYINGTVDSGRDSYPTSLRIVAWTRFLAMHDYRDRTILAYLYQDLHRLSQLPEYHLDGNHLWENAVALICGGTFFRHERSYEQGKELLLQCLEEQLFKDGGHVEGSPMYHSLLLWRLLQCIELVGAIGRKDGLKKRLEEHACNMLGWLNNMTFSDGSWPAVNDTTEDIAPTTEQLLDYAMELGLRRRQIPLSDSGYRMIQTGDFELFIDVADIMPGFQPGHSHADIGNFCIHHQGIPVVVDRGVSTYEDVPERHHQRSTAAHNTINIDGQNSSELWKSFRVGKRAKLLGIEERANMIAVAYAGYAYPASVHRRTFEWSRQQITITDALTLENTARDVNYVMHFHPDVMVMSTGERQMRTDTLEIEYEGLSSAQMVGYEFCKGFNITLYSQKLSGKLDRGRPRCKLNIRER